MTDPGRSAPPEHHPPYVEAQTAAFLARLARDGAAALAAGFPVDPNVAQRRQGLVAAVQSYGPGMAAAGPVQDRTIAGPDGPVPVRIYLPARPGALPSGAGRNAGGAVPLLLHIHGGGWVLGDPDGYGPVVSHYAAASGCVVVDVDYRRAPEHKYPAAARDCEAALDWAHANARALGADPRRIVVTGDSAGGHLAAGLCQRTRTPVALQILMYPVISAGRGADFASRRQLGDGRWFLREFDILRAEREYFEADQDREAWPGNLLAAPMRVLHRQPPTLIVTAGLDPLRDEGEAYAARLQAAGVKCELRRVEGTIHGFVLFASQIDAGRAWIDEIGRRVRRVKPAHHRSWLVRWLDRLDLDRRISPGTL